MNRTTPAQRHPAARVRPVWAGADCVGFCHASLPDILSGLYTIFTMEDVLITDYIAVAGIGAAFVNAGLVTLVSAAILWKWDDSPTAPPW